MAKEHLDTSDQHIMKAVCTLGWLSEEQTVLCLREMDDDVAVERYLFDERLIDDKQLEHLLLYRNLPESIAGYQIKDVIGAGAMGVVYLADNAEQQGLALKVINKKHCDDEEFIKRFQRETQAVSALQHENIVSSGDSGTYEDQLYLATDYVDGPSLVEVLDDYGPLPEQYVLKIIGQVAQGLDHAYETCGIVHRDIKPANILIDHQGHGGKDDFEIYPDHDIAKIIDFGLAKRTDDTDNLTLTGLTVGTPHYMAPEQIRADRDIDCRADIYSVGATIYHLLTGQTPYVGNSPGGIMLAHVNDEIPDPSAIVPSLKNETVELVMCSLGKTKEERYVGYDAFLKMTQLAIEACCKSDTGIQLLRKPLKMSGGVKKSNRSKNKKTAKQSAGQMQSDLEHKDNSEGRLLDIRQAGAVTVKTNRIKSKTKPIMKEKEADAQTVLQNNRKKGVNNIGKSSSSLRRILNKRLFQVENSAVSDEDMQERLSVSPIVWVGLTLSVIAMIAAVVHRYMT
ncbi:MAG: serine/threonine protein kinase [Planctomycetes bacterium]|nr:serine/threonine protein kinase [Planctomycetota bacterium]